VRKTSGASINLGVLKKRFNFPGFDDTCNYIDIEIPERYLKFDDITFYNPSVYHYNLHDKQN
jgi:hypothetical protein